MKPGKKMLAVISLLITACIFVAIFGIGEDVKGIAKMRFGIDIRGGVEAVLEPENYEGTVSEEDLERAREIIEMRLDSKNITDREVTLDVKGGYIIVRFPWKSDETEFNPEAAIEELGEMAQLTFRDSQGNVLLEGKNVLNSSVQQNTAQRTQEYVVSLSFDKEGSQIFEEITGDLIGQQLGIYMDDTMISCPTVESQISGGEAVINGMGSYEAAKELSEKINAGALPFSLSTTSFSTISPTLGYDSLQIMIIAGIVAFVMVCLFMMVRYKLLGVVSCVTLLFQMVLQLLAVSVPQYTLTLPGIAGIILSMGMAVDANIIIYERVAEELKKGNSILMSLLNGYKRGFISVLDGNITTAIVAVVLMVLGSGSMLSFGYTLLAGMVINVFIGVTVSKIIARSLLTMPIFENEKLYYKKKREKTYLFFQKRWICLGVTSVLFLVGIIGCAVKGVHLDTQFTGGVVLEYRITEEVDLNQVKSAVKKVTERTVTVRESSSRLDDSKSIKLTFAGNSGMTPQTQKEITAAVKSIAGESTTNLSQTYAVEPYIGEKALKNAVIAIVISFLLMMIYIGIRFSVLSGLLAGVAALVALLHDVCIVFFAFVVFGFPLNDAFVAVVLTIIGYSINDTIVVYDRIRENRTENKKIGMVELMNTSVSQVLARSLNTSITTILCVLTILVAAFIRQIDSIIEFSLPMLFGLISGCYSSIFIASILWMLFERMKEKKENNIYEERL